MFAYIQNNKISFLSTEKLDKDFLPDIEKYQAVEYDNAITDPIYNEKTQKIEQKKYKETRDEKFARVYKKLLALPTINKSTDKAILEGIEFTDKERGMLTEDYAFNGNLQNQLNYMMAIFTNTADTKTLHDAGIALGKLNGICEFFGLNPLKIPGIKEFTEAMNISPAKKLNS